MRADSQTSCYAVAVTRLASIVPTRLLDNARHLGREALAPGLGVGREKCFFSWVAKPGISLRQCVSQSAESLAMATASISIIASGV